MNHFSFSLDLCLLLFTVLNSSLAILNTTANRLMFDDWENRANRSECIRCAVVGNGGILNGSRKGKEIDEHDYVFRWGGWSLRDINIYYVGAPQSESNLRKKVCACLIHILYCCLKVFDWFICFFNGVVFL